MDAQVKKDKQLENQKCHFGSKYYFYYLRVYPFLPGGFFTFLVAHGRPSPTPHILVNQFTLFKPGGQIIPTTLLIAKLTL